MRPQASHSLFLMTQSATNFRVELGLMWKKIMTNAINLTVFTSITAFVTYVLGHVLGHCLGDADTRPMEPIAAHVTTNIKPRKEWYIYVLDFVINIVI